MTILLTINRDLPLKQNQTIRKCIDAAIGFSIYFSTLYVTSNIILLITFILLFIFCSHKIISSHLLVLGFVGLALINIMLHLGNFSFEAHSSSFAVALVFIAAVLAPNLPKRSIRIFVLFVLVEILVGFYELSQGTVALTEYQASLAYQNLSYSSTLLYDIRVFGLSANSSVFAEKIFVAFIFFYMTGKKSPLRLPVYLMLFAGLIITFNRTAIVSIIFFIALLSIINYRSFFHKPGFLFIAICVISASSFSYLYYYDEILNQLFRGNTGSLSNSELTRLSFWQYALQILGENPFSGNGSLTFRILDDYGILQHAHNSYIMVLVTHGVLIPIMLFLYVVLGIRKTTVAPILSVLAFSSAQYFIFWNLSVPDILLFWLVGQSYTNEPSAGISAFGSLPRDRP